MKKSYIIGILLLLMISGYSIPRCISFEGFTMVRGSTILSDGTNDFILDVGDQEVLLLGEDVWNQALEFHSGLLSNTTVRNLMSRYNDSLLFIDRTAYGDQVIVMALNESHYMHSTIRCTYNLTYDSTNIMNIISITSIDNITEYSYVASLKNAISTLCNETEERDLELANLQVPISEGYSALKFVLWSYDETGYSFYYGNSPVHSIFTNQQADSMLIEPHWEFLTYANLTVRVSSTANPNDWEYVKIQSTLVASISQTGELIQLLSAVPPAYPLVDNTIVILGIGIVIVAIVIIGFVILKKKG